MKKSLIFAGLLSLFAFHANSETFYLEGYGWKVTHRVSIPGGYSYGFTCSGLEGYNTMNVNYFHNSQKYYPGGFNTLEEAVSAACAREREYYGD